MVSFAQADAFVTLTATTPEEPGGGYLPGATVDFEVSMTQDTASDILLRLVTLNFEDSDPALGLKDPFVFNCAAAGGCALYAQFPNYADPPNATYTSLTPIEAFMFKLPAAGTGSLLLGTGQVNLPMTEDKYLLDVVNESNMDPNGATQIRFGFGTGPGDEISEWFASDIPEGEGMIFGDPLSLTVIPEPATLALLALGGIAALRRRR
jgi:hypothetical protein